MEKQKWSYNGVELNTKAWNVINIAEGIGIPVHRGSNIQVPFQHGKRWIKKRFNERVIMLPMWVRGLDPLTGKLAIGKSQETTLDENIDYLSSVFGKEGQHVLRRTLQDGTVRETTVEIYTAVNFVKKLPGYAIFSVEFLLSDPFFYEITKKNETKTINIAEYSWTHVNVGTAPVTNTIITLTGPLVSPKIENLNNNVWLQYQGTIAAGESVVIYTKDFICFKGSTNMIAAIKHGGDSYWITLESGNNSLKITTDTTGGTVKIEYYPAYF